MRNLIIISAFVMSVQGVALADQVNSSSADSATLDVSPPPEADTTCQAQQLPQCQTALTSCQTDVTALLDLVQKTCESFKGMSKDEILENARKPKTTKTKVRKHVKQGNKPVSTPLAPKAITVHFERVSTIAGCTSGGLVVSTSTGGTVLSTSFVCDGKDGKDGKDGLNGKDGKDGNSGRPGMNGSTRVEFGLGMRTTAIWSNGRPLGLSASPEASLELWLAPTVEFVAGIAWAPNGDRNMVVTSQLRYRGIGKRIGFGVGIQYQAWNLVGNKALWQSVLGMAAVQVVLFETSHVDISAEAGILAGLDGYDANAQFAIGGTGQISAALKF